jgi:hypothetical protein
MLKPWVVVGSELSCVRVTIAVSTPNAIENGDGRADARRVAAVTTRLEGMHPGATIKIFGDRLVVSAPRATFRGGRFFGTLRRSLLLAAMSCGY